MPTLRQQKVSVEKVPIGRVPAILLAVITFTLFGPAPADAQWWNPFGPSDYEDCAERAARDAKSKEALTILLQSCNAKFTARRKPGGGYTFYDPRQQRSFDISGPNPTKTEMKDIDSQYQLNAELETALERRRQSAVADVKIVSSSLDCIATNYCGMFKLTLRVRNSSPETISSLSVGWAFAPRNEKGCPTSVPTKKTRSVMLQKGETTILNIDGHDGPNDGTARYCVDVTDVTIMP
jgi:hypothetical protein